MVATDVMDSNDLFGKFIASELKELPARAQRLAKHEIENILFKIQMQSEQYQTYSTIFNADVATTTVSSTVATTTYTVPPQKRPYLMPFEEQQCSMPWQREYCRISSENKYNASTQFEQQNPSLISSSEQQYQIPSPVFSTTEHPLV